jgi:hypothetical protein
VKEFAKYSGAQTHEFAELAQLENTGGLDLFKVPVREPDREKSVVVSLQRVRGEGTFWAWTFPYVLPTGWKYFRVSATCGQSCGDRDSGEWRPRYIPE